MKVRKNPVSFQKDDEFDQLLNSFDNKIKSAKNVSNQEDKDDW